MKAPNSMKKKARPAAPAAKRSSARRIGEGGDERAIQHLKLPREVVEPMRQRSRGAGGRVGAIWDAACSAFARTYAEKPYRDYKAPYRGKLTTLWIDSRVLQQCRKIAERDGVSVSRIIHSAACEYLEAAKERG